MLFYPEAKKNTEKTKKEKNSLPGIHANGDRSFSPMKDRKLRDKRAAFCTFQKGSLTVEAAFALPLFFLCVTACIYWLFLFSACAEKTTDLMEEVETLGMAVAGTDLQESNVIERQEKVSVLSSWLPFRVPAAETVCYARVHAWTGRSDEDAADYDTGSTNDPLVYVTEYQSVYHTSSLCTHLHLSIRQVAAGSLGSLRNSSGGRYHACEKCVGSGSSGSTVYITDQGDKYHNSLDCSGLTRSVQLVALSKVSDLHQCSRCAALEKAA